MTTPGICPYDWHRGVIGPSGSCQICGCPKPKSEHRAVARSEKRKARWILRIVIGYGYKYRNLNRRTRPRKLREYGRRMNVTPRTIDRVGQAARLAASGKTTAAIAEVMGMSARTIWEWKAVFHEIWKQAYDAEMEKVAREVKEVAGTDAVLNDPAGHFERARRAEKWLAKKATEPPKKGTALFPVGDEVSLCSFFRDYYLPVCLADARPSTIALYNVRLKRWRLLTGDPPINRIDVALLAKFRQALLESELAAETIKGNLRNIQTLLDKCGPPRPRNRDAAGYIPEPVPWVRPPVVEEKLPKIVGNAAIEAAYGAADTMTVPRIRGVDPPAWWRALLVIAYNTGLRTGSLLTMRWTDIDWENRRIVLPGSRMKARRVHISPLNETAFQHLVSIRTSRELVFEWGRDKTCFHKWLHRLQDRAGVPRENHFNLKQLRKTLATRLGEQSLDTASMALGHAGSNVTLKHYILATGIVARAIDGLIQPGAFAAKVQDATDLEPSPLPLCIPAPETVTTVEA